MKAGWWWRNRWGLVALVPAYLAAIAIQLEGAHHRYWKTQPRVPVTAAGAWVSFAGARLRLIELAPAELRDHGGRPYSPPRGVGAWRAVIAVEAPAASGLGGCRLMLEDAAGRVFETDAAELRGARIPSATCTPARSPAAGGASTYEIVAHFATPGSAQAVAVRVTLINRLPAYARLTAS